MRSRVQSNMLLPIEEVESIIRNVVTGLSELQQKGYEAHGDINMNTVYYCKKEKFFKIVHPLFCESGFLLALQETRFTALSPEQLSQMDRNR